MPGKWRLLVGSLSASIAFGASANVVYKVDPTFLGLIVPLSAACIVCFTLSAATAGLLFATIVEGDPNAR